MWCVGVTCFMRLAVHRVLQALLGLPPPRYHHHRLILDADGSKLSKSSQSTGLRELRARGAIAGRNSPSGRARLSATSVALSAPGLGYGEAQTQEQSRQAAASVFARKAPPIRARSRPRSPASRTTSARR